MDKTVIGEVLSYCIMNEVHRRNDCSGWCVMFRYRCPCGKWHDGQALNTWSIGDHKTDTVEMVCPNGERNVVVELVRP